MFFGWGVLKLFKYVFVKILIFDYNTFFFLSLFFLVVFSYLCLLIGNIFFSIIIRYSLGESRKAFVSFLNIGHFEIYFTLFFFFFFLNRVFFFSTRWLNVIFLILFRAFFLIRKHSHTIKKFVSSILIYQSLIFILDVVLIPFTSGIYSHMYSLI